MHAVSSYTLSTMNQRTLLIQCLYFYIHVIMLHIDFITVHSLMWAHPISELVDLVYHLHTKKGNKRKKANQGKIKLNQKKRHE